MCAWKYREILHSTLEINLVFPRTHVLFSISSTLNGAKPSELDV